MRALSESELDGDINARSRGTYGCLFLGDPPQIVTCPFGSCLKPPKKEYPEENKGTAMQEEAWHFKSWAALCCSCVKAERVTAHTSPGMKLHGLVIGNQLPEGDLLVGPLI